jgi:hypothetical protein
MIAAPRLGTGVGRQKPTVTTHSFELSSSSISILEDKESTMIEPKTGEEFAKELGELIARLRRRPPRPAGYVAPLIP